MSKIKRCPFCGYNAELKQVSGFDYGSYDLWIECSSCHAKSRARHYAVGDSNPESEVVASWNRRVNE